MLRVRRTELWHGTSNQNMVMRFMRKLDRRWRQVEVEAEVEAGAGGRGHLVGSR